MAKSRTTLKQRIAFEGGEEMEAQLAQIGKAGEAMIGQLRKAFTGFQGPAKRLSDAVKRLKLTMQRIRTAAVRVGTSFRKLGRRAGKLRSSLGRMSRSFALITAGALGAAGAVAKLAQSSGAAADAAGKQAEGLGLTVDEYGRLAFAAEQAGLETQDFGRLVNRINQIVAQTAGAAGGAADAMGSFGKRAGDARERIAAAGRRTSLLGESADKASGDTLNLAEAIRRLGVTFTDENGKLKDINQIILELSDAFNRLPDGIEKSILAVTLLPELGRRALPFFNQGADAIRRQGDEAERLGLLYTRIETKIGQVLTDNLNLLKLLLFGGDALKGLQQEIGLLFGPSLSKGVNQLTKALAANRDAIRAFAEGKINRALELLKELFEVLFGGAGEQAGGDVLAFGGGLSEFQLKVLGVKIAVLEFVEDVKAAFENILLPLFDRLLAAADFVAAKINAIFGTNLSGRQLLIAAVVAQLVGAFGTLAALALTAASAINLIFGTLTFIGTGIVGLVALIGGIPAAIVVALVAAGVLIFIFWDDITAAAQSAWDSITGLWGDLPEVMGGFADAAADFLIGAFRRAVATIKSLLSSLISLAKRAFRAAKEALGLSGGGSASGAGVPVLAGGGQVRGPGTPTSDSILARLSDQEFVVQARAVRHYGASFFAALNAMRLPKFSGGGLAEGIARSLTLPLMPGAVFAAGGPVTAGALAPAVAKAGTPVNLTIENQTFRMMADDDIAEALGRVALTHARARIGRPPRRL